MPKAQIDECEHQPPGVARLPAELDGALATVAPGPFDATVGSVLAAAGLDRPTAVPLAGVSGRTGRDGVHTEAMGYILAELQSVARAYPDATW